MTMKVCCLPAFAMKSCGGMFILYIGNWFNILSHVRVTIDRLWIGNWIYWTLIHTTCDYPLQITITHRLAFSVMVFTALLGNIFQQWTFFHAQAGGHLTPTSYSSNHCLKTPSVAAGPCYIALAWDRTENTTSNSYFIIVYSQTLPRDDCFSGSTVLALSK
jgi:hypothetical protein